MIAFFKKLFTPSVDFARLVKEGAVIVDVRTRSEYQAGHIQGSKNIPVDTITKEAESLKKLHKPIITVCRTGNRSGMAKSILTSTGIEAYNGGTWTNIKKQITAS